MHTAIDFGISNIDAVAYVGGALRRWTQPSDSAPTPELVRAVLAAGGVDLGSLRQLAVTGGRPPPPPPRLGACAGGGGGAGAATGRGGPARLMVVGGGG